MIEYGMAFKAVVELVAKLDSLITDRKTRELLLPLKEKLIEAQQENFNLQRQHAEEMGNLKAEYHALQASHAKEVDNLHATIRALQAKQLPTQQAEFDQDMGAWFDSPSRLHYCPHCWVTKKESSPMTKTTGGLICPVCQYDTKKHQTS
jgi:beta-phosphoglucomutase-like phosphatase (HAD superfamily)